MTNISRTVVSRTPKADDIEIHVSELKTDSGDYIDVREYVVSLEQYSRGITYPARLHAQILVGMEGINV